LGAGTPCTHARDRAGPPPAAISRGLRGASLGNRCRNCERAGTGWNKYPPRPRFPALGLFERHLASLIALLQGVPLSGRSASFQHKFHQKRSGLLSRPARENRARTGGSPREDCEDTRDRSTARASTTSAGCEPTTTAGDENPACAGAADFTTSTNTSILSALLRQAAR
jgi:hypothetical protein